MGRSSALSRSQGAHRQGRSGIRQPRGEIAAAILGRAKEDLLSEELRQQRRNFAWASRRRRQARGSCRHIHMACGRGGTTTAGRGGARARGSPQQHAGTNAARSRQWRAIRNAGSAHGGARWRRCRAHGGIDLATLEPALYEISAKIPNGLVAAAQVTWPTRRFQLPHALDPISRGEPTCACTGSGSERGQAYKKRRILPRFWRRQAQAASGGDARGKPWWRRRRFTSTSTIQKATSNISIEDLSGDPAKPFRTIPSQAFGEHLDGSAFSGKVCPDLKRAVISVTRWSVDSNGEMKDVIGRDTYVVMFDPLKVTRILDDFGIDSVACSPDGRFIAGAPDRGNLAILDVGENYVAARAAGDLARAAAECAGRCLRRQSALLPSMTQIRGTATRASLKLLAGAWKDSDIRFPTWDGVGARRYRFDLPTAATRRSSTITTFSPSGTCRRWDWSGRPSCRSQTRRRNPMGSGAGSRDCDIAHERTHRGAVADLHRA